MQCNVPSERQHPSQNATLDTPENELWASGTEQGPTDTMLDDGSTQAGEEVNLCPVAMVVTNVDLLQILLGHLKPYFWSESPGVCQFPPFTLTNLRLVSHSFNTAVLSMPYPPPITLNLNKVFPDPCFDSESPSCLAPSPHPLDDISNIFSTHDLAREVCMELSLHNDCDGHTADFEGKTLDVEAINFFNFSSVYGHNFRILKLTNFSDNMSPHLARAVGDHCLNLRDLTISMYVCQRDDRGDDGGEVRLSSTLEHLSRLTIEEEWHDYADWGGLCPTMHQLAKGLIDAAPNLESLEWNNNMTFDLRRHRKLTHLRQTVYPRIEAFDGSELVEQLSSAASSLVTLKLAFETTNFDTRPMWEVASQISIPPMSALRTLDVSFLNNYNFGPSLAPCLFNSGQLDSLAIKSDDPGAIGNFLLLLQDNGNRFRNGTLTRLEICGRNSGICNISHLGYLHHAFPGLKIISLAAGVGVRLDTVWRGGDNMKAIFLALAEWTELESVELKVNFPLKFVDMCGTFRKWVRGRLQELKLEVEHHASLFSHGPRGSAGDIPAFRNGLMALRGLKKVFLVNFMMPGGVGQALMPFIQNNGLPVCFLDTPSWM